MILRVFGRELWHALRARNAPLAAWLADHADVDALRVIDRLHDAAETVFERERIVIVPCRAILDPGAPSGAYGGWPVQDEMYLGRWPDGSSRNLTRDQVLMMAGMDALPDEPETAGNG